MNRIIAYELINSELASYRSLSYRELASIAKTTSRLVRGSDGVDYEISTTLPNRSELSGDIQIQVSVSEANWGAPFDSLVETVTIPK